MPSHRSRPIGNADTSGHRILASRSTIRQADSRDGCDRASAKDFHEIRAVFTRGVALSPSLDQLGAIEREASFL